MRWLATIQTNAGLVPRFGNGVGKRKKEEEKKKVIYTQQVISKK